MSATVWPLFLLAAAGGAVARYELGRRHSLGILTVNVVGSIVLGLLTGLAEEHGLGVDPLLVLGAGFCGSLTTFSTVSVDVAARPAQRWRYGAITTVACLAAAAVGVVLGRA